MLVLLPPSETKREGGDDGAPLDLSRLSLPTLTPGRRSALAGLRALSSNLTTAAAALGLGPSSSGLAALNRTVRSGPTMPALDRFDGVLYDALDAPTLSAAAREFADERVLVASALFGLLGPEDPIPAYRLSAGTRLPGRTLRGIWREAISGALAARTGLVLDLRSEAYAALGPAPSRDDSVFLRVVERGADGARRALNHDNKAAKGRFTRWLLESGVDHPDHRSLIDAAAADGIETRPGADPRELELIVAVARP